MVARWTRLFGVVGVVALVSLLPAAANAVEPYDWVELELTAGDPGADAEISMHVEVYGSGDGPTLVGIGSAIADFGGVQVLDASWGGFSASTTQSIAGLSVRAVRNSGSLSLSMWRTVDDLPAGTSYRVLLFVANGSFDLSRNVEITAGSATATWQTGTGSTALSTVTPEAAGTAAAIGGIAAGNVEHRQALSEGVAGAMVLECASCTASWSSP